MTGAQAAELICQRAWVGQKPGLERIRRLLGRLGDPQRGLKFIHIAGSNGKGSTAAMAASVLTAAGVKTGLYTSPHLWQFHERFQVDGTPISEGDLVDIAVQVLGAAENETEFELITAIAMVYFQRVSCDIVVLETGLGGRLDSTNIIEAPEATVITNIGLEHTQLLGDTLEKIAEEKAGIVKCGAPCVLYRQGREVEQVVEQTCRERGSELVLTRPETLERLSCTPQGQTFTYQGKGPYHISLLGEHQLYNAAVALETVWLLARREWNIPEEAVRRGLERAVWPARMELARRDPDVILDGGHNPQCIEALSRALRELYPGKKIIFLTGVLADKNWPAMMEDLLPLAGEFYTITPDSPRAVPAGELAEYLEDRGIKATPCGSAQESVDRVLAAAGPGDVMCACGSLYMIGEVRHLMGLC